MDRERCLTTGRKSETQLTKETQMINEIKKYLIGGIPRSGIRNTAGVPMSFDDPDVLDIQPEQDAYELATEDYGYCSKKIPQDFLELDDCLRAIVTRFSLDFLEHLDKMDVEELRNPIDFGKEHTEGFRHRAGEAKLLISRVVEEI